MTINGIAGMYSYIILFNFNLISNLNLLKAFIKMIPISKDKPLLVSFTILALEIDTVYKCLTEVKASLRFG